MLFDEIILINLVFFEKLNIFYCTPYNALSFVNKTYFRIIIIKVLIIYLLIIVTIPLKSKFLLKKLEP